MVHFHLKKKKMVDIYMCLCICVMYVNDHPIRSWYKAKFGQLWPFVQIWITICIYNSSFIRTHSRPFILCVVYDWFCNKTAKLNSCSRDHMALKPLRYLLSGSLQRSLKTPDLKNQTQISLTKKSIHSQNIYMQAKWRH